MLTPREAATAVTTLVRAGLLRPVRPDQLVGTVAALRLWGLGPGGGYASHAARHRRRLALVDPEGELTYGEVDALTTSLAAGLRAAGLAEGDPVGVLCGNARGFVLAVTALAKLGASAVLLNTGLAGPALAEVAAAEGLVAVVHDPAYDPPPGLRAFVTTDLPYGPPDLRPPSQRGRFVILTSGTTGRPKGAHREPPSSLQPVVGLLSAIPLHAGEPTVIAAPLFHAWGFAQWLIGLALGSTIVVTGAFDADATLAAVERHCATALVAVPVMLRRLLDVETIHDTSSLRVVAVSGSALPPDLAARFMGRFGDVLYDLYGSTEVAWASIATPADLRDAPGSVGRPPFGTTVRLVDERDGVGRIVVGNGLAADMPGRETVDGLMPTGDLGRFDEDGRLYVVGREDDMVVSGGENVFPRPVEEALAALPGVADVAVHGVPDDEFGQRLRAVVVRAPGATLTADDVRAAVRERLGRHYVPRDVDFVAALPRNAAGKVVRRAL